MQILTVNHQTEPGDPKRGVRGKTEGDEDDMGGTGSASTSRPLTLPDQTASEDEASLPRPREDTQSQHSSSAGGF